MSNWQGKVAFVTGAASGIGLALSKAMIARGAIVWMTDVNPAGIESAGKALGPNARSAELDVRDAAAVRELIERAAKEGGQLDYVFNNAGIGIGGEAHELTVAHYDRIIDINIRGVVHGVVAAYPIMVKQRRGHIINTASVAGLVPGGLLAPYALTKHAVVGLSLSLRPEAANFGVGVSALCPSAVDTPILDSHNPPDLPQSWHPDIRRYLTRLGGAPYPVDRLAEDTLRGVERNLALIVTPRSARIGYLVYRMFPGLVARGARKLLKDVLAERPKQA